MELEAIRSCKDLEELLAHASPPSGLHIGQVLAREKLITEQQLNEALAVQQRTPGRRLGEVLYDMGIIDRRETLVALAESLGIPLARIDEFAPESEALAMVPSDVAVEFQVIPLAVLDKGLAVAMANPFNSDALSVLQFTTNHNIRVILAPEADVRDALQKHYFQHRDAEINTSLDQLKLETPPTQDEPVHRIELKAKQQPIVRLVNAILMEGIAQGASDINIRPDRHSVGIYYRIDGKLHLSRTIDPSILPSVVSRIKITAAMNIADRRRAQDGHAWLTKDKEQIDLRVSVIPTVNGESVVIRIVNKSSGFKTLPELGLPAAELHQLSELLNRNYGMLLVTGPTGSGKTTTLYSILHELRKKGPHLITIEDPVEYDMDSVEQIQVAPQIGQTFAENLRHILRHDPDVIMVGEIRDLETASIAAKASLTGHLVLSTLHTNDAASTVTRLVDMGVEPYIVASTLLAVVAQRLVRINCPECSSEETSSPEWAALLGLEPEEKFLAGSGCKHCNHTGYRGRAIVIELLRMSPTLADAVNRGVNAHQLKAVAEAEGMVTLTQNALNLARSGVTSLAEVMAVRLD